MNNHELPLPTDTALVRLASRQYRLFNLDLGEGIPRVALKVGACVFVPWLALCYLLGVSFPGLLLLWLLPPVLITWGAMSRDEGGRLRVVGWADWASWAARRHAPIVNAGTTSSASPRPVAAPIAFLVSDLRIHEDLAVTPPDPIRPDFEETRPRGQVA